jgi:hypothetical protein
MPRDRFGRGLLRLYGRLLAVLLWQLRMIWWRMSARARIAAITVMLIVVYAWTDSSAPSLSAAAEAFAVLVLALIGFVMILTAPFRARR